MKTDELPATMLYDCKTGDAYVAQSGEVTPSWYGHFDNSVEAENYCDKRGIQLHLLPVTLRDGKEYVFAQPPRKY